MLPKALHKPSTKCAYGLMQITHVTFTSCWGSNLNLLTMRCRNTLPSPSAQLLYSLDLGITFCWGRLGEGFFDWTGGASSTVETVARLTAGSSAPWNRPSSWTLARLRVLATLEEAVILDSELAAERVREVALKVGKWVKGLLEKGFDLLETALTWVSVIFLPFSWWMYFSLFSKPSQSVYNKIPTTQLSLAVEA